MTQEPNLLPNSLTSRVAIELRAEMARQQISQKRLAELLGVDQAVISRRLTGVKYSFTTKQLDTIANTLGVPVDRFLAAPAPLSAGAA